MKTDKGSVREKAGNSSKRERCELEIKSLGQRMLGQGQGKKMLGQGETRCGQGEQGKGMQGHLGRKDEWPGKAGSVTIREREVKGQVQGGKR
ncbi:hypothetical protein Pmani_016921 [Petrolisthes manimaculis]|uniref:Uncharacterized protein n=1 Tax=Petrolisthes manimaculis TaxID=1843537 RepID=A0AAE1U9Y2_9EUCA|nr:hypothetical protein Pmani_016921 [Petrolisthes manimaculis]